MKKGWIYLIVFLVVILAIIYYYNEKTKSQGRISRSLTADRDWQTISYTLPTTVVPEEFGPYYWKAIHDMASRIPCGSCRHKWETFTEFGHDFVNYRLGKPFHNKKNFDEWMEYIDKTKEEIDAKK